MSRVDLVDDDVPVVLSALRPFSAVSSRNSDSGVDQNVRRLADESCSGDEVKVASSQAGTDFGDRAHREILGGGQRVQLGQRLGQVAIVGVPCSGDT